MLEKINDKTLVLWQESGQTPGEPALLIRKYADVIEIHQGGRYINITHASVNELIKILKQLRT